MSALRVQGPASGPLCSQSGPQDNVGSAWNSPGQELSPQSCSEKNGGLHVCEDASDRGPSAELEVSCG